MSQYDLSNGSVSKWLVTASVGGTTPWEVWSYDDLGNTNQLSVNYVGTTADVVSPAVAAGIGPVFSSDIGNTQYTTGYYPRDYSPVPVGSPNLYYHIWSRSVDVYTGVMSSTELQVDNISVNYDWDINRIYAVSNSSNSGYNILTAYYDSQDIVYKESPNSFSYKPGKPTTVKNITNNGLKLFPNPATSRIRLSKGGNRTYTINDLTGRILLSGQYDEAGIDINDLPSGFYLLQTQDDQNNAVSLKFMKH